MPASSPPPSLRVRAPRSLTSIVSLLALLASAITATTARPTSTRAQSAERRRDTSEDAAATATVSDADRAQARALFQAGAAAVEAGRWADAVTSYRAAFELTSAPSALFNTGFALRALGRYREARDAFERLLTLPNVSTPMQNQARELLPEVRERIGRIRLGGLEPETRYGVRLDGSGVEDTGERPFLLEADPGEHAVDVMRSGYETFTWSGALENGGLVDVPVQLVLLPTSSEGSSVADEPWFWTVLIGVVLVGGGLATYFVLDDQAQLRPDASSTMVFRL